MPKTILILTQRVDPHIPPVDKEIARRGMQILRFDFSDFPARVQLAASLNSTTFQGKLRYNDMDYALSDIQSVWWRRPTPPQAPPEYDRATRAFLNLENLRGFLGVLSE